MTDETRRLAAYAASVKYDDLPPEVLDRVRNTIADTIGVMIYGYELPWSQMIVKYAQSAGPGGRSRIMAPNALSGAPGRGCVGQWFARACIRDGRRDQAKRWRPPLCDGFPRLACNCAGSRCHRQASAYGLCGSDRDHGTHRSRDEESPTSIAASTRRAPPVHSAPPWAQAFCSASMPRK